MHHIVRPGCRYTFKGAEYRGPVNTTRSGKPCKAWEDGSDENYCRNQEGGRDQPWCHVDGTPDWEYCDIPVCGEDTYIANGTDTEMCSRSGSLSPTQSS